jgi:small GTP-binding protein
MDYDEKILELEKELSTTKYNKRTQHHIGLVKAKIAKIKDDSEREASKKGKTIGYAVKKTGDATVVLLGFPSVGKSTLLNHLTNADSEVAAYEFTTLNVVPGMLTYKGAKIQILDIPGIVEGASRGAGRGKEVMSIVRAADLILIMVEPTKYKNLKIITTELYKSGIRLNKIVPDVKVSKKAKGGIDIGATVKLPSLNNNTIKEVMREFGYVNASIVIRQKINIDELIDILQGNKKYVKSISIMNKSDIINDKSLFNDIDLFISATKTSGLNRLKSLIFKELNLKRIYMKEPNKETDFNEPMVLNKDETIRDVCNHVHRGLVDKFRFSKVWGSSKFPGQKHGLNYKLKDKDIVQLFFT